MSRALTNIKRIVVSIMFTMVTLVLTSLREKYIVFQSKMLYDKRVIVFGTWIGVVPHGKRNVLCLLLTMVCLW